jgi:hypothetical protein
MTAIDDLTRLHYRQDAARELDEQITKNVVTLLERL